MAHAHDRRRDFRRANRVAFQSGLSSRRNRKTAPAFHGIISSTSRATSIIVAALASASAYARHHERLRDPDRLDVGELADSLRAKFATEAGTFHAAKWKSRIGSDHAVDENDPGIELGGEKFLFG